MVSVLPLTRGRYALVDDDDLERVASFSWSFAQRPSNHYAIGRVNGRLVLLHRFILNAPPNLEVDHQNGDGLDCRRENLRLATHSENQANARIGKRNTSGFKGVSRARKLWRADICHNRNKMVIGLFEDAESAARAYDVVARQLRGPFAALNFPDDGERAA